MCLVGGLDDYKYSRDVYPSLIILTGGCGIIPDSLCKPNRSRSFIFPLPSTRNNGWQQQYSGAEVSSRAMSVSIHSHIAVGYFFLGQLSRSRPMVSRVVPNPSSYSYFVSIGYKVISIIADAVKAIRNTLTKRLLLIVLKIIRIRLFLINYETIL